MSKVCIPQLVKSSHVLVMASHYNPYYAAAHKKVACRIVSSVATGQRQFSSFSLGRNKQHSLSSVALHMDFSDEEVSDNTNDCSVPISKHCTTCTCDTDPHNTDADHSIDPQHAMIERTVASRFPCGREHHEDDLDCLADPLPEPKYSVHKRVLPSNLTAYSSKEGKKLLMEALFMDGTAESYWNLTQHFINQGDPAFCGVTTLIMCLNAMCIDPNIRWRGGWRYYGSEEVLLDRCCLSIERIRRSGITLEAFAQLGRCQGLQIQLKRPTPSDTLYVDSHNAAILHNRPVLNCAAKTDPDKDGFTLEDFRHDIQRVLSDEVHRPLVVVSFSRQALGQTGDGHFSTLAAYHRETEQVLVLDVARFKYPPYWVSVDDLYRSMQERDSVTNKPRGWMVLFPPANHACQHVTQEDRRPVEVVPLVGERDICPIGDIRRQYCAVNAVSNNS